MTSEPNPDPALRRRALLERAQAGAPADVEALLGELAPLLRPVTWRLAGPLWGDDALQEAMLMIYQRLAEFSPGRDPLPLARTIAARRALDLRRHELSRGGTRSDGGSLDRLAAPPGGSEMMDLLNRLAPADRQILVLTELEQFSAAEAGAILGVSAVAARVRALRARRRLRALWDMKGGRLE